MGREHGLCPEDPQQVTIMPPPAEETDEGQPVREGKIRTAQCQRSQEDDGQTKWSTQCYIPQMSSQRRAEVFTEIGGLTPLIDSIT